MQLSENRLKHELKVAARSAAVKANYIVKIERVDAREDERREWRAYYRSARKAHAQAFK